MFIVALSANDHTTYDWIVDYGAMQHMTFEQEWFTTYEHISPRRDFMGDDTVLKAMGKGNIKATMKVGGELTHTTITQVLHVPKMKNNFISGVNSFLKVSKWNLTRMVVRSTMFEELLWWKHEGTKTCTFLM